MEDISRKKICKVFITVISVVAVCSLTIFIPQVRNLIIAFGENLIGRSLTHEVWHGRFIKWELKILCLSILAIGFLLYLLCSKTLILDSKSSIKIFNCNSTFAGIKHNKTHGIELIILLISLITIRCFYISQKKSMHVDEGLTISICNRNEYGFWGKNYELDKQYTGKELKEISLFDNSSLKDSLSDVFHMHQDNRDSPHTNLYYSLFRLWFTGVKTANLDYIFWRGCLLNIVFFVVSYVFMFFLLYNFTKNKMLICLALFVAFINPASLSLTVFLRPYELQQTMLIILSYYISSSLQLIEKNERLESKENFLSGVIILAFTMLSAYFNMIIIGIYGLVFIIICLKKKNFNLLKFFLCMFVLALLLAKILYFKFGDMGYRAEEGFSNLKFSAIKANFLAIAEGISRILAKNIFFEIYCILICCITVLWILLSIKNKQNKVLILVLCIEIVSVFAIMYFAPIDMKTLRYIAPLFPLFSLVIIPACKKWINFIVGGILSLLLVFALIPNKKSDVVEHLDDSHIESYNVLQENERQIFVRGESTWRYSTLIPYIPDSAKVVFISELDDIKSNYNMDSFVFVNQKDDSERGELNYEALTLQKIGSFLYHDVYLFEK
ncbi:MAG: hypothetical protein SOX64_02940 [Treponema sp.]|nr:hypothetical protein [Treponema sp.]